MRDNTNSPESRKPGEHFEGEPAGNRGVWRRINGHWATGVQEWPSVFAVYAEEESEPESDWQEFPWEKQPNESSEEQDENTAPQPRRSAVIRHDEHDDPSPLPVASNRAGPSRWRPAEHSPQQPHRLRLESHESSDDEADAAASSMAFYAARHKKPRVNRGVACQFIDSMAAFEGGSKSDMEEEKEDDASRTTSDDSFIVGDDIFD